VHLGGAVDPAAMWGIAHSQGIRLPTKDYWEFVDLITVHPKRRKSFEDFLELYHWTELIQSSPIAVEQSVYEVIGGAYRKANITTLELRYNPLKRNRGGERDVDHIIMASIRGLDRAALEYPVKVGLIFCLDRTFGRELNEIVVDKAIQYRKRGVVGIDIAGPHDNEFRYSDYATLYKRARKAGLGLTVHAGEDEVWSVPSLTTPLYQTTTYRFETPRRTPASASVLRSGASTSRSVPRRTSTRRSFAISMSCASSLRSSAGTRSISASTPMGPRCCRPPFVTS